MQQPSELIKNLEREKSELIEALIELINEPQPLGIDRPAYQRAVALVNRFDG